VDYTKRAIVFRADRVLIPREGCGAQNVSILEKIAQTIYAWDIMTWSLEEVQVSKMEILAGSFNLRLTGPRRRFRCVVQAFLSACLAALPFVVAPSASAEAINFSTLPTGNNPNPLFFPGATFTTISGFNYITTFFSENAICPSISSTNPSNCTDNLEVELSTPSSGISFTFSANNDITIGDTIGAVQLFDNTTFLGSANLIVQDTNSTTFEPVDLSGFTGVTKLLISNTDLDGLVYSDFTFTPSSTVPEPATWRMILGGCLLATAFRRRLRLISKF
jgi:PEP-CTERM motif-containing protein